MKKVLIDVRDDIYDTCVNEYHNGTPFLAETVIAHGKVLSGMTNGEVIMTLFDRMVIDISNGKVYVEGIFFPFDEEWWNALYIQPATPTRRVGKWIRKPIRNNKGGCVRAEMICTYCGKDNECDKKLNYCPYCGAYMQEVNEC